jgi:hypothetical protein
MVGPCWLFHEAGQPRGGMNYTVLQIFYPAHGFDFFFLLLMHFISYHYVHYWVLIVQFYK